MPPEPTDTAATAWQPRMVWKFRLTKPVEMVDMPAGATVLTVATQQGKPTIWALVDTSQPMESRRFFAVGTGMDFLPHPTDRYIGTAHNVEGEGLVFHFFERAIDAD